MWKVIYIAKGKTQAEDIRTALMNEGYLVTLRPVGRNLGEEATQQFEIMSPHAEAVEAYQLLTQVLRRGL